MQLSPWFWAINIGINQSNISEMLYADFLIRQCSAVRYDHKARSLVSLIYCGGGGHVVSTDM